MIFYSLFLLMQQLIDFWNEHPILAVLSGLFAFVPLVSWLFRLLLRLCLKLISKLSGKAIEQQQLRDKIIDIVSRPLLALRNTLRFGLSWFSVKRDKKLLSTYYIYISIFERWYSVWLKNNSDLELERNDNFRTFKEARESVNQVLWTFTILYEHTDKNWIHVIAIKRDRLTVNFLNEASKQLNQGLFCHKLVNKQREYLSLPMKEPIREDLLNL